MATVYVLHNIIPPKFNTMDMILCDLKKFPGKKLQGISMDYYSAGECFVPGFL